MNKITKRMFKPIFLKTGKLAFAFLLMSFLFANKAFTQITARTATSATTAATTTITIAKPTGLTVGDLMIANIVQGDNSNGTLSNATLSGWTLITGKEFDGSSSLAYYGTLLYKVATETDVAVTGFTFTLDSDNTNTVGGIVAFAGVAVTGGVSSGPFHLAPGTINSTTATTITATTLTTTIANAAVVMFGMVGNDRTLSGWTTTSPGTLTELFDQILNSTEDMEAGAAWAVKSAAGATGNGVATMSSTGSDYGGAIMIALQPCTTNPTITSTGTAAAICSPAVASTTTLPYTATTGTPVSYTIDWNAAANTAGLADQSATSFAFAAGGGTMTGIVIPASMPVGTYSGTLSVITSGGCRTSTQAITVTINSATANAGAALAAICKGGTSAALGGSVGGTATGGTWADGGVGGTFNTGATDLNTTWSPPAAYSGTATLTLTSTGGSCASATASKTIVVNGQPTATAGGTAQICAGSPVTVSGATSSNGTISWTKSIGTGTFTNTTGLTPTYTPASTDATQTVTLTMTVSNPPCMAATATFTVNVVGVATSNAGTAITTCSNIGAVNITAGSSATNTSGVMWTTTNGTGTFTNPTSLTDCTYTPSAADYGQTRTLVLTATGNSPCSNATASKSITITRQPVAVAGTDVATCSYSGAVNITAGSSASNQASITWSAVGGTGTFVNPTSLTTCTYTPSAADIAAGVVTIRLTANPNTGCAAVTSNKLLTITTPPAVAPLTGTQSVCVGSTTTFSTNHTGGTWSSSNALIASVNNAGVVSGVASGTATITYTATTNNCSTVVTRTVTVNPLPTTVTASGAASICPSSSTTLTGSASIPYVTVSTISDNFNGTPGYTAAGTSSAGNIFAQKNSGDSAGLTAITNNVDSSKFMMAVATSFGSGTTTSTLTSPTINTNGYSTLSFGYVHSFSKGNSGTNTGLVQVSIDNGITWTTVKTYSANQGANNSFVTDNVNLDNYVNKPNFKIRFNATLGVSFGTGWWAVDNPTLTTGTAILPLYSWTADTAASVNGLPSGATTPSAGNASISVNPSTDTNYTLVAQDPLTGCTQNSTPVAVTIKATPVANTVADQTYCNGNSAAAITLSGTPSGITFDISGGAAIGLANVAGVTSVPSFNAIAGSSVITITPKANGCVGTPITYHITVNPTPTVFAPANQTYCNGISAAAITLSGTPSGVMFDISGGASVGLANATNVTAIPSFNTIAGSATISITPKANGCTGSTVTYSVLVNPVPTVNNPGNQSYCNGFNSDSMALTGTPSGVTFSISGGASIGLANASGVTAIPAFNPVLGNASITITPSANGCTGTPVTFTATVNPILTPTFTQVAPICSGGTLSALPATSNNGISGTWSPALNNTSTTTYTFLPNVGQCGNPVTMTIVVNTNTTYYADTDGDGYGDAASSMETCLGQPNGYVTNGTDCDVNNANAFRNGLFFVDTDMDGYNDGSAPQAVCYGNTVPSGFIAQNNGVDCNDFDAEINPWHVEVLGNGADDNCDGNIDEVGPVTVITASQCGSTLSNIANTIYVSTYAQATGYRFQVTNGSNVRLYDTDVNRMSLLSLPGGATYNTTYSIRVSLLINGFWQAYGASCNITTPANPATTNIVSSMCGTTLASMSATIYCNQVSNANQYRFEVSDGINTPMTIDTPSNRFCMASVSALYNTTYSVRVALRFGSAWQDYGSACSITTPETPGMSHVISSQCGTTINSFWTTIYAQQVSDASGYRFEVTNGATVRYYDSAANRFALRQLGAVTANTEYTIRVAILFNSVYQAFGSACTITTSSTATGRHADEAIAIFDVKISPNPYVNSFKIDMNTSGEENVTYKVYDMLGRQVEAKEINVNELGVAELGAQYPSGVYNIIVAQGENVKTLRVIRR